MIRGGLAIRGLVAALAALFALTCFVAGSAFAASAPGLLAQLPGPGGCVVDAPAGDIADCANDGRALAMYGWGGATVSPDGHSLYVAAPNSDAFAVFDRNPGTGAIAQKLGAAGCIVNEPAPDVAGCTNTGRAIAFASSIAISPDGRNAYVAGYSSAAVAVFDRDALTGALVQKEGTAGCIVDATQAPVTGCDNSGRAMIGAHTVVVSPDGLNVYLVSDGNDAVAVFDRDTSTGAISQKAGAAGCVVSAPLLDVPGCDNAGRAMGFSRDIAVSPDGKSLYLAALVSDAIAVFDRDPLTGAITQKAGAAGCIVNGPSTDVATCDNSGRALDGPLQVVVAPGGGSVHVAAAISSSVATFDRDTQSGALTQKPGAAGCIVDEPSADVATCDNSGRALASAVQMAVSPDGMNVYVAATGSNAVATFDRDIATGTLTQRAGAGGCLVDEPSTDVATCANTARGLGGPQAVTVSPDGTSVYLSGVTNNSVVGLRRDLVPVCQPVAALAPHNQQTPVDLTCRDPNGDPLTLSVFAQPAHGSVGSITQAARQALFSPNPGFAGSDSFSYVATANGATSDSAVVTVDVAPGAAPVCAPQARSIGAGTPTVLALTCAAGGDPFTYKIGSAPAHGSLGEITQSTGFVSYTPSAGYSGDDAFAYSAGSGFGEAPAVPFALTVLPATMGPQGPIGPVGPTAFKLEVALFSARVRVAAGKAVTVRYVSTLPAHVQLAVLQKSKVVARVSRDARVGANAIAWNGRIGRRPASPGAYRLQLAATNGDQSVTRSASLTVVRRRR